MKKFKLLGWSDDQMSNDWRQGLVDNYETWLAHDSHAIATMSTQFPVIVTWDNVDVDDDGNPIITDTNTGRWSLIHFNYEEI